MSPGQLATASSTVARISSAAISAASCGVYSGCRRVFTCPASGCLAKTMSSGCRRICFSSIPARQTCGRNPEPVTQSQPPHAQHRARHAISLPAPHRDKHRCADARGELSASKARGQLDILHEWDRRESSKLPEYIAAHEDRLIASSNAGERRAQVHEALDDAIDRLRIVETDIKAAPEMTGLDRRANMAQRLRGQAR